jgi:signal transduction histidine kinase
MEANGSSSPIVTDLIGCHRCGAEASVRAGKEFLCARCAEAGAGAAPNDQTIIVCDLCARESLVRLRERFLCAHCALAVLSVSADDVDGLVDLSVRALDEFANGEHGPVLAHGPKVGRRAREGTVRLADVAAVHHAALARSMRSAADPLECVLHVEGGGVIFNMWATAFDARLGELERQNEVLTRMSEGLERQIEELDREREEILRVLRRTEADRRWAIRHLIDAKEQERRRISLDIHDDALQAMVGVRMQLEAAKRREEDSGRRAHLEELEKTTLSCIGRLRALMFELRTDLERRGLAETLRQLLQRTAEQLDLVAELDGRLTHEPEVVVRTNLYRIAQEAVANVRKHAQASRIEVALEETDGGIQVTVRDDGMGFCPEAVVPSAEHLGLEAMRERARLSGGWLRVDSAPSVGTTVTFWAPTRIPDVVGPSAARSPTGSPAE